MRLGVNIDHVATLRRLRDTSYPDILLAAKLCIEGGADQITVHLREDRRHIVDADVALLKKNLTVDLNLEMGATPEMLDIALQLKPHSICVVPEKREERTTEGGLDLGSEKRNSFLATICKRAQDAGILVSFFIEPHPEDLEISKKLGAHCVELHTGQLCLAFQNQTDNLASLKRDFERSIRKGQELGLSVHAGHGIDYNIARQYFSKVSGVLEYNIGHSIVCESVFVGIKQATQKMKDALLS